MNAFSALVVTLVDLFGPICTHLILVPSSIYPYMFYILDLGAMWWLIVSKRNVYVSEKDAEK